MSDSILVINAGSSSIKFALYWPDQEPSRLLHGMISGIGATPGFSAADANGRPLPAELPAAGPLTHDIALERLFEWLDRQPAGRRLLGAAHRVVHGGERYTAPCRLDTATLAALEQLVPLAPLHQPHNLAAVRALMRLQPALPQVACFDTAFHAGQPAVARNFALPRELTVSGVRRYGFHGLSYEYIAGVLPARPGARAADRVVIAHLGAGASLCATKNGKSIATTMGFTALEGLVMGTRTGSIDPGVLFYLMREKAMTPAQVEDLLYRRSGLLGVSGISSDMRELLASASPQAREAVELFCYRAAREIGSLAAALEGLDSLVFTAGIGERAAPVRARICELSRWLGIELDETANREHRAFISAPGSQVEVHVIPTDEEMVIARHAFNLLKA